MKRYNITADDGLGRWLEKPHDWDLPDEVKIGESFTRISKGAEAWDTVWLVPANGRIKIDEADNGEWVRYEDAQILAQAVMREVMSFVELADQANDPECYCDDERMFLKPEELCLSCQFQEAIDEFRRGNST